MSELAIAFRCYEGVKGGVRVTVDWAPAMGLKEHSQEFSVCNLKDLNI